jgi:hypothetical protein
VTSAKIGIIDISPFDLDCYGPVSMQAQKSPARSRAFVMANPNKAQANKR